MTIGLFSLLLVALATGITQCKEGTVASFISADTSYNTLTLILPLYLH
jgi:hypothetical protein